MQLTYKQKLKHILLRIPFVPRMFLRHRWGCSSDLNLPKNYNCNATLKSNDQWQKALKEVKSLGLPAYREDCPKNWDSLLALSCILEHTKKDDKILDAGAELYSVILPWLYLYGYKNLTGINLMFGKPIKLGPIVYEYGDITRTKFSGNTFAAITCMSVIEHGVDLESYFKEMIRILKPGGLLITSTDYYETSIETGGQTAYGTPIKIFSKKDIMAMISFAADIGLDVTADIDLTCMEKPVHWDRFGLDYTYVIFSLKKRPN